MQVLAHSAALIIDLRKNSGGDGAMGLLLAAYLFDGGEKPMSGFYSRPTDETAQRYTPAYVPGRRFGEKRPVYLLVSKKTFSAAEAFAYDLQALGRVTVVGEPTGGGAHPFEYSRLTSHFVLWLVKGRSLNPITRSNWQGTGVKPDVRVPATKALQQALLLARRRIADRRNELQKASAAVAVVAVGFSSGSGSSHEPAPAASANAPFWLDVARLLPAILAKIALPKRWITHHVRDPVVTCALGERDAGSGTSVSQQGNRHAEKTCVNSGASASRPFGVRRRQGSWRN